MTYQYAIRYASGGSSKTTMDGLGGDPAVLAQLLRPGDELVRREVGEWEVVDRG